MENFRIVQTNKAGMELVEHGTALFPLDNIYDDFSVMDTVIWHWHPELELGVVVEGELQISIDTQNYDLRTGDAFFVNAEVLHAAFDKGATGCILRSLVFHPRLIGGSQDSIFFQRYVKPLITNEAFKGMVFHGEDEQQLPQIEKLRKAIFLCDEKPVGYELKIRSILSEILLYLLSIQSCICIESNKTDKKNEMRFRKMLQMIEARFSDSITLGEIAGAAFISKRECIRCFKNITGRTPIQYLKEYRLHKAAELLLATNLPVSRIGESCGFMEMSYFARSFRKQYSVTPSEYRKNGLLSALLQVRKQK